MQKYISLILVLFGLSIYAQETVLSGVVVDENNIRYLEQPFKCKEVKMELLQILMVLSSMSIQIQQLRCLTQAMRNDFIGLDGQVQINLFFNALEEVVITALGIRRAEKALGYAVQGIKAGKFQESY